MPRSILLRLTDMRDAIQGITALTSDLSYESFVQNWGAQRAIERGLEIISEASRHVPDDHKALAPGVPWRQIAAIGNLLRHEYQRADSSLIWNIVVEHLPGLAEAVGRMIEVAEAEPEQC
jgi:uncharacterized protein with HEPN domain